VTTNEQYRALIEQAGIGAIAPRHLLSVAGKDRAAFLHGLLSNEVRTLTAGTGCYATWLTPQGRMITDLHVFETGESMLLDVPADIADTIFQRLDQSLFSEDVQLAGLAQQITSLWIHGPRGASIISAVIPDASAAGEWAEYTNGNFSFHETSVRLARVSQLGVPGFCLYVEHGSAASLRGALERAGAISVDTDAIHAARIEAGYPVFGIDMTTDTIPLEAGIEDRAISFTKGCYVGQEVIVRVMHRGGGRVARRLMALRFEDSSPPAGAKLFVGDRELGWVTSVARSPRTGAIGLGYVHRDSAVAGTRLTSGPGGPGVVVSERPISGDDR
jgi:folate-binding protein YgfZ